MFSNINSLEIFDLVIKQKIKGWKIFYLIHMIYRLQTHPGRLIYILYSCLAVAASKESVFRVSKVHIQSESGKIRTRKSHINNTKNTNNHFSLWMGDLILLFIHHSAWRLSDCPIQQENWIETSFRQHILSSRLVRRLIPLSENYQKRS